MKFLLIALLFTALSPALQAQKDSLTVLQAFTITDYTVKLNDSTVLVQVQLPDASPISITDKQMGVLRRRYNSDKPQDTGMVGYGRCHLIKGDYYYFAITKKDGYEPQGGELLYSFVRMKAPYKGLLLGLYGHQVQLQQVDETLAYRKEETVFLNDAGEENVILDSLVKDIRYTAQVMLEQMPEQNQVVEGGIYNGKKLFVAMQAVTRAELQAFLKYMLARPEKYAGHTWKTSEVFATWMVSKTPQVK